MKALFQEDETVSRGSEQNGIVRDIGGWWFARNLLKKKAYQGECHIA